MSRIALRLEVVDVSAFARSLRDQFGKLDHAPSHVETLHIVSRSAGFRNFQHLRAAALASGEPSEAGPLPDYDKVAKVSRHFDAEGRLLRWPGRAHHQALALWAVWSRIPAGEVFAEREFGALLDRWHTFGDAALLRRALVDARLVRRTQDGREYRRTEQKPVAELRPLLARQRATSTRVPVQS